MVKEGIGAGQAFMQIAERKIVIGAGFGSTEGTRCWDIISIFFSITFCCYSLWSQKLVQSPRRGRIPNLGVRSVKYHAIR